MGRWKESIEPFQVVIKIPAAAKALDWPTKIVLQAIKILIDFAQLRSSVAEEVLDPVVAALILEVDGERGAVLSARKPKDVPSRLDVNRLTSLSGLFDDIFGVAPRQIGLAVVNEKVVSQSCHQRER